MPGSVNRVVLMGTIGQYGVEVQYAPSGTAYATLTLDLRRAELCDLSPARRCEAGGNVGGRSWRLHTAVGRARTRQGVLARLG